MRALCLLAICLTLGACLPRPAAPTSNGVLLSKPPVPQDEVLPPARDMLIWNQDDRVVGFRNTYRQYSGDVFHASGAHVQPLPSDGRQLQSTLRYAFNGIDWGLDDYVRHQNATGLLVLKNGKVALEYYGHGNTASTLWTSRSVAKSVVSILVGIAIKEGLISSVDDPATKYLPDLKGTAWDGVSLRNLLQHTSGVQWNEDYADPNSDFSRLTHCEAGPDPYDCIWKLLRSLKRRTGINPGEAWSYNTGGAWLVGRILESATGMPLARYLESRLWQPVGMESDGVWQSLVPGKIDMGGHGFNATLRDWGRFGLFVSQGGRLADGRKVLPDDWLEQSTRWTRAKGSVSESSPDGIYGFQWWNLPAPKGSDPAVKATAEQTIWAVGIFGQAIAINRKSDLVMVQWSAFKEADGPDSLFDEQMIFLAAVNKALQ